MNTIINSGNSLQKIAFYMQAEHFRQYINFHHAVYSFLIRACVAVIIKDTDYDDFNIQYFGPVGRYNSNLVPFYI